MKRYLRSLDTSSLVVLAITVLFFVIALFEKGLTHDMLLEAGVFLVSVKLMMLSYKASAAAQTIARDLAEIKALLLIRATPEPNAAKTGGKPVAELCPLPAAPDPLQVHPQLSQIRFHEDPKTPLYPEDWPEPSAK